MRSVLSFFSMLALGLMIAAVILVAPSGNGTTSIAGFELSGPTFDYRSVVAGLGIGLFIALISQISWGEVGRRMGGWLADQAQRVWLIAWAGLFIVVLFYF
jgi:hypothetical protein